jgi:hypothetical protein
MTKKKNLAKNALKHPWLFSPAELAYFEMWLKSRKSKKQMKHESTSNSKGSSQA